VTLRRKREAAKYQKQEKRAMILPMIGENVIFADAAGELMISDARNVPDPDG